MTKNQMKVEILASSQEDLPGTHNSVQIIAQKMCYSKISVDRQLRKSGYKSLKRPITRQANHGAIQRRLKRWQQLLTGFSKLIFTDEKDFTLQVASNRQNNRLYTKEKKGPGFCDSSVSAIKQAISQTNGFW